MLAVAWMTPTVRRGMYAIRKLTLSPHHKLFIYSFQLNLQVPFMMFPHCAVKSAVVPPHYEGCYATVLLSECSYLLGLPQEYFRPAVWNRGPRTAAMTSPSTCAGNPHIRTGRMTSPHCRSHMCSGTCDSNETVD